MTAGGDIVVVGSANADVVVSIDRLPLPGETIAGSGLSSCAGGKGANQAAAAARLLLARGASASSASDARPQQRARLVALFGDDAAGASLKEALAEGAGVDLSLCRTLGQESGAAAGSAAPPPPPTGTALILLLPSGENSIVVVGGANQSDEGWEAVLERGEGGGAVAKLLSGGGGGGGGGEATAAAAEAATAATPRSADNAPTAAPTAHRHHVSTLLLQREVPDWVNTRAAGLARGGAAVVLDAGGAEGPLPDALLACVNVLSPNETELARLVAGEGCGGDEQGVALPPPPPPTTTTTTTTSLSAEMRAWVERAARALLARLVAAASRADGADARPRAVLVKLGAAGSALFTAPSSQEDDERGGELWQPALQPDGPIVDTTGAGDCFTAAFAVARYAEGRGAREAMLFASAAACLCVQRRGAQPSMPRREEVDALLLSRSSSAPRGS